jgi:hypothetical protein
VARFITGATMIVLLVGLQGTLAPGAARAEESDPRAAMRTAASERAETHPAAREAVLPRRSSLAQLEARVTRGFLAAMRRAVLEAVRDSAGRGPGGPGGPPDGPPGLRFAPGAARGGVGGGVIGDGDRDAEGAARNHMVRDDRHPPPPPGSLPPGTPPPPSPSSATMTQSQLRSRR